MPELIDLKNDLIRASLPSLLKDKTTKKNIVFATDSYADKGDAYAADMQITIDLLDSLDLKPRILKSQEEQALRTREKAEVFTPAWLCCKMNNHCDDEWFGTPDVFNHLDGEHWEVTAPPVMFNKKKKWTRYVDSRRLEITCGEAPYIVSRYDAATGIPIDVKDRIGILDRKLRIVNENTSERDEWLKWTLRAFQSVYGYEWQGDSLLIARINLLMTFLEHYKARWEFDPKDKAFQKTFSTITNVIVWNFWQMDGLTGTVPHGVPEASPNEPKQLSFFDLGWVSESVPEVSETVKTSDMCRIFDWRSKQSLTYTSMKKE